MTVVHRTLTRSGQTAAVLLAMLLAACAPADPEAERPAAGSIELPPSLSALRAQSVPEPPFVDPERWRLTPGEALPPHAPVLRVLYGQDTRAELEACGCPGAPTGGFARRATLVRDVKEALPDVLILEGPALLSKALSGLETLADRDRSRARELVALLPSVGVRAFFPGQPDFAALAPRALATEARAAGVAVVVSNLDAPPSTFKTTLIHEIGGARVLFLGLLGTPRSAAERAHAPAGDPVEAAARLRAEQGPFDLVVAFTSADLRERRDWVDRGLSVDVLLAPFEVQGEPATRWVNDMLEVRADPLGRALRVLDLHLSGGEAGTTLQSEAEAHASAVVARESGWIRQRRTLRALQAAVAAGEDPRIRTQGYDGVVRVDPATDPAEVQLGLARTVVARDAALAALAPGATRRHVVSVGLVIIGADLQQDAAIEARIAAWQGRWLDRLVAEVGATHSAAGAEGEYSGMDACVSCHQGIYAAWPRSAHASAYRVLKERGQHRNPDCLQCHTTGFGVAGGFVDPSETSLLNVQCEACHGPMARHVRDAARPGLRPGGGRVVDAAVCRSCHDAANSPEFDFDAYLPRIAHPGVATDGGR